MRATVWWWLSEVESAFLNGSEFHIGNCKNSGGCCCFDPTPSFLDASCQDHVAVGPAALIRRFVATFIQFLRCFDVEDLTWKGPTSGSDLMFPWPRRLDAPCCERAVMENVPPIGAPPPQRTHFHAHIHILPTSRSPPSHHRHQHCSVGLRVDV